MKELFRERLDYLPYNWITVIISLSVAFFGIAIPDILLGFIFNSNSGFFGGYEEIYKYIAIILFVILISSLMLKNFSEKNLGFEISGIVRIIIWAFAVSIIFNIISFAAESLDSSLKSSSAEVLKSLRFGESNKRDIISLLTVSVFAPIWEELIYRALAFRALRDGLSKKINRKISSIIAVVFSSILFMSAHSGGGQDAQQIYLFILGVLLALSFLYTGSLLASILAHSFNNTFVIWLAFAQQGKTIEGMNSHIILVAPMVCIGLFMLIKLLYFKKSF